MRRVGIVGVGVVVVVSTFWLAIVPAAADRGSDTAIAKRAVLKVTDLPPGWKSTGPQRQEATPKSIASCAVVRKTRAQLHRQPHALSLGLARGGETASATVFVLATEAGAKRIVDAYDSDDALDCVHELGLRAARAVHDVKSATFAVTVQELTDVGDEAIVFDGHLSITTADRSAESTVQTVVVRVGRAIAGFNFQTSDASPAVEPGALEAVVHRLRASL